MGLDEKREGDGGMIAESGAKKFDRVGSFEADRKGNEAFIVGSLLMEM